MISLHVCAISKFTSFAFANIFVYTDPFHLTVPFSRPDFVITSLTSPMYDLYFIIFIFIICLLLSFTFIFVRFSSIPWFASQPVIFLFLLCCCYYVVISFYERVMYVLSECVLSSVHTYTFVYTHHMRCLRFIGQSQGWNRHKKRRKIKTELLLT